MKNLMISAAVSVAALASAQAAVLDFEDFGTTNGEVTLVGNEFEAVYGITLSSNDDDLIIIQTGPPQGGFVPNDTIAGNAFDNFFLGTSFDDGVTHLLIEYTTPVDAFSFDLGDVDGDERFEIVARNADGTMSSTKIVEAGDPLLNTGDQQVTSVAFSNLGFQIASIELSGTRGTGRLGIAFDNFSVSSDATVPVPAAAPLFAAGLAGFGALRRRKKQKSA